VDAAHSEDQIHGWGPRGGYVFQKAFVEFFVPKNEMERIRAKIAARNDTAISFYAANKAGEFVTNAVGDAVNAVTWGVFPGQEIVQSTIIEETSFLAWKVRVICGCAVKLTSRKKRLISGRSGPSSIRACLLRGSCSRTSRASGGSFRLYTTTTRTAMRSGGSCWRSRRRRSTLRPGRPGRTCGVGRDDASAGGGGGRGSTNISVRDEGAGGAGTRIQVVNIDSSRSSLSSQAERGEGKQ